ncbi:MAG: metallophosphoesterase [Ignavibacteriales bacterium]|nr:metallophosphoesterase [Ignavibacteriales bacterium]
MKIIFVLIFFVSSLIAQDKNFDSNISTEKKPWSHLDFYNNPDNFQFAIVSDNTGGSRKGIFEKSIGKVNLLMPEFVMCVGDLIQGYTQDTMQIKKEWDEFNSLIENLKPPFFYLPGNHDITNNVMQKEWEKRYGRRYYHFVYKNVLFITMDSNDDDDYSITTEQRDYVIQSLKDNPEVRWTFLFFHHPIWKYDTNNRFQEIEEELAKRKFTVFAGHEHHYIHQERNDRNYYVLGTTGGGSALRGHRFGEFDHITWLTLTDDGPVFANLELDGIHDHDISNDETDIMAESLIKNTRFEHVILSNSGNTFKDGTVYLYFQNNTDFELNVNLQFYHNHELKIDKPRLDFNLIANSDSTVEISLVSKEEIDFDKIGQLQFDWHLGYTEAEYSDFYLEGKYDLAIIPVVKSSYITPNVQQFKDNIEVNLDIPFKSILVNYTLDGDEPNLESEKFQNPITISQSTVVNFKLFNNKNQEVAFKSKQYEKLEMIKSVKVDNLKTGLDYKYYEGEWEKMPDYSKMKIIKNGLANDFTISDIANIEDNFGLVYEGFIEVPNDEMYIFRMRADDASKLYLHNNLIVDGENGDNYGAVYLEKGFHPIKIEYMEQEGNERLRMYYKTNEKDDWTFMEFDMFFTK